MHARTDEKHENIMAPQPMVGRGIQVRSSLSKHQVQW